MNRNFTIGLGFAGTLAALGITSYVLDPGWLSQKNVAHAATTMAPRFEVDPLWPKPLPNHWIMGQTIGVSVDAQDHVWIIHRARVARSGRTACHHQSADRAMLRRRASGAGVRSGRAI